MTRCAALRRADRSPKQLVYREKLEEHDMGEVLMSAVFDAFDTVFFDAAPRGCAASRRPAAGCCRRASCRPTCCSRWPTKRRLWRSSSPSSWCGRSNCPLTDIKLGEFLRAMITADTELRPDDPWALREALIDAFLVCHILPRGVFSLSEDSLLWSPPRTESPPLARLSFSNNRFASVPGCPVPVAERLDQARALGRWRAQPGVMQECGLVAAGAHELAGHPVRVGRPCIDALDTVRRVAADGDVQFVQFDPVAVVTQSVQVPRQVKKPGFSFVGGCTLLFSAEGLPRLIIRKSVAGHERVQGAANSSPVIRPWRSATGMKCRARCSSNRSGAV